MKVKWEVKCILWPQNLLMRINLFILLSEKNIRAQLDAVVMGTILGGKLVEDSTLAGGENGNLVEYNLKIVGGKVPAINIAEQSTMDSIAVAGNTINCTTYCAACIFMQNYYLQKVIYVIV